MHTPILRKACLPFPLGCDLLVKGCTMQSWQSLEVHLWMKVLKLRQQEMTLWLQILICHQGQQGMWWSWRSKFSPENRVLELRRDRSSVSLHRIGLGLPDRMEFSRGGTHIAVDVDLFQAPVFYWLQKSCKSVLILAAQLFCVPRMIVFNMILCLFILILVKRSYNVLLVCGK